MSVFQELAERLQGLAHPEARPPAPGLNDLLIAASKAMDLLEGKPVRSAMRVAVIAGSVARLMELPSRTCAAVVYAALLHDIGLVRITSELHPHLPPGMSEKQLFQNHALLNARVIGSPHETPLSGHLVHLLQQHPLAARPFLERVLLSEDVIDIVAAHHELCDGTGYPFGLSAEQIPFGAKIVAFADVVEGVISEAPGAAGLTTRRHNLDNFLEIKAAGKFDAEVVAVFRGLIDTHEDFLKSIASLEVEAMIRMLLPERTMPVTGGLLLQVVQALGELPDAMLPMYKRGRCKNVSKVAMSIAERLGIHRAQIGELACAAMLMDLGHLGTPVGLLLKQGPLVAAEREVVQNHVLHTQEVLKGIPGFENIRLWASEAHERMNGKGYPGHKKGFDISVGGRILALADVFDAFTHARPYRTHALEPLDALPMIGQGRVTLYDSQLVSLLRKVVLDSDILVPA